MVALAQLADDREAVLARQHDVEHDQVEVLCRIEQARERAIPVVQHLGVEALRFQVEAQPLRQVLLVFDNQDALGHALGHQADAGAAGSCSVKVLPCPCPALSAKALPPCFLATERTMNSPRPLPFVRTATLAGNAVEALEDPFELRRRNPDAVVGHADGDPVVVHLLELDDDLRPRPAST